MVALHPHNIFDPFIVVAMQPDQECVMTFSRTSGFLSLYKPDACFAEIAKELGRAVCGRGTGIKRVQSGLNAPM